mmetsp:Transcript_120477/g.351903  ORF Transcript_120477/g.351903 Transcript_120477/m.351903 type:complete len:302 (-) Transcript_120477:9-914(-)
MRLRERLGGDESEAAGGPPPVDNSGVDHLKRICMRRLREVVKGVLQGGRESRRRELNEVARQGGSHDLIVQGGRRQRRVQSIVQVSVTEGRRQRRDGRVINGVAPESGGQHRARHVVPGEALGGRRQRRSQLITIRVTLEGRGRRQAQGQSPPEPPLRENSLASPRRSPPGAGAAEHWVGSNGLVRGSGTKRMKPKSAKASLRVTRGSRDGRFGRVVEVGLQVGAVRGKQDEGVHDQLRSPRKILRHRDPGQRKGGRKVTIRVQPRHKPWESLFVLKSQLRDRASVRSGIARQQGGPKAEE